MQGMANRLKGVNIGYVSSGNSIALVNGFVKEGTALAAESDGGEIVELGAGAAHQ